MNKKTLIWTLVVAVPVGLAALATGYVYRDADRLPSRETADTGAAPEVGADGANERSAATDADAPSGEAATGEQVAAQDRSSAETAEGTPVKGPSFDVVGVEPTGETVVAGRSTAGAIVALTANGNVVGKSIANQAGEWTIILDEPLKPGDYDVGLEVHDESGTSIEKSEQHLAVSVPEDGKEQPLVVLNTPEGPSDIIQKPETETQVADAGGASSAPEETSSGETGTVAAPETSSGGQPADTASEQLAQRDAAPAGDEAVEDTAGKAQDTQSAEIEAAGTQDAETQVAGLTGEETPVDGSARNVAGPAGETPASDEETALQTGSAPQPTTEAADRTGQQGGQAPSGSETASQDQSGPAAKPAPTVTVEAVESEPDKVYVAGTGKPGTSVRVYVGDDYQGEAEVGASGKWLVQGTKTLPEGNVEVRADLIGEDGSSVDARAAVTFEKERNKQVVLTKVVATGTGTGKDSQGAEVKKSLPVVIIRKGVNLWRISRRLYGDGIRYTTIYQANQDQIRNPDLIYPGQVFLTPEGDLNWQPQVNEPG